MTMSGDMPLHPSGENEPTGELLADVLSLVDQTVARVTDADVSEHMRSVLSQAGFSTDTADPARQIQASAKDESSRAAQAAPGSRVSTASLGADRVSASNRSAIGVQVADPRGNVPEHLQDGGPLTPRAVRNKQFSTTRLRPGYEEAEVDGFLDRVEVELDRLIQENEELRAKLAEVLRGGGKLAMPALASPLSDPRPDMMSPEPMAGGAYPVEDSMDTAARILSLAQRTADQAIADVRREADETIGRARREADEVVAKARRQAEQITGDARARTESFERDSQERHRQALSSLVQQREDLDRRIDDLRAFEREYRSRLKSYLEGQLRDLEAGVTDSGTFPVTESGTFPALPDRAPQPRATELPVADQEWLSR